MIIRLEYKGSVIHETEAEAIASDISIGRSRSCTWSVPDDDRHLSSVHLVLYRDHGQIWVREPEPSSKNGSYVHGERLKKPVRLKTGDRVTFGPCVLFVGENRAAGLAKVVPEIIVLTGNSRGQSRKIQPPGLTIGSDPKSGLVLLDELVSRAHTEIMLKADGTCWIRDLASKNGTSVNGMPLRESKERLLKDGDRIGIAHLELRFQDGTTQRSGRRVLINLIVLGITLAAIGGIYWLIQRGKPSAVRYVAAAQGFAERGEFHQALAELLKADSARDAGSMGEIIASKRREIGDWQSTESLWKDAQLAIQEGAWSTASRALGALDARSADAWRWSKESETARQECRDVKRLLDATARARTLMALADWGNVTPAMILAEMRAPLQLAEEQAQDYLTNLVAESKTVLSTVEEMTRDDASFDTALGGLTNWPPALKQAVAMLGTVKQSRNQRLKLRAEMLVEPLNGLAAGLDQLTQCTQLARDARFDELSRATITLPSKADILLDSRLGVAWDSLRFSFDNLKRQGADLAFMVKRMDVCKAELKGVGSVDQLWRLDGNLQKVLGCDALELRYSVKKEDRPLGEYDRYLGLDQFYEFLRAGGNKGGLSVGNDADSSRPLLAITTDLFDAAQKLKDYTSRDETQWLRGGALSGQAEEAESLLAIRDGLLTALLDEASRVGGRRGVIAAGIVLWLSPVSKAQTVTNAPVDVWVSREVKALTDQVRRLSRNYEEGSVQDQMDIREKVLQVGLPGDRDVKRMWISRAGAGEKP